MIVCHDHVFLNQSPLGEKIFHLGQKGFSCLATGVFSREQPFCGSGFHLSCGSSRRIWWDYSCKAQGPLTILTAV